jgi:hypothetical protein
MRLQYFLNGSKVKAVFVASTWHDYMEGVCDYRGKQWWNSHAVLMKRLRREWGWDKDTKYTFLLLGKPRLVFNPPIHKDKLQKGRGFLNRRFFCFDDLFSAWGGESLNGKDS